MSHCRSRKCPSKSEVRSRVEVATDPFPFVSEADSHGPIIYQSRDMHEIPKNEAESFISRVDANEQPPKLTRTLPPLNPRNHADECVVEVDILEKHKRNCVGKRKDREEGRNPNDDKVGSYDVISRAVYHSCGTTASTGQGDTIRNSPKGFRLNDPEAFKKPLIENRTQIDATPILPTATAITPSFVRRLDDDDRIVKLDGDSHYKFKPYDKKEEDDSDHEHHTGDECRLHDPIYRSKQLLAIQKLVKDDTTQHKVQVPIAESVQVSMPSEFERASFVKSNCSNATDPDSSKDSCRGSLIEEGANQESNDSPQE